MKQVLWFFIGALVAVPALASAQSGSSRPRILIGINGGGQAGSQPFTDTSMFPLYGEEGRLDVDYDVDRSGGLFDAMVGARLWRNFGIAVSHSRFTSWSDTPLRASVPHPLIVGRPRDATAQADRLRHQERAIHVHATWTRAFGGFDVSLFAGPSVYRVDQDVLDTVTVGDETPPFDQIGLTGVVVTSQRTDVTGVNVGADVTFLFSEAVPPFARLGLANRFGIGAFLRYAGASADIALPSGTTSLDIGGVQAGAGLRFRF